MLLTVEDDKTLGISYYKFFCFNGKPEFLYVSQGLENHDTASISFLTTQWSFSPYERIDYKPLSKLPQKPDGYDEMLRIAEELSRGFPFIRIDLYWINHKVWFSELTFFPGGGFLQFRNSEHDLEIGSFLNLQTNNSYNKDGQM